MTSVSFQTDYWVETSDPTTNLSTDEWVFELTLHPSFTLSTDLYRPEFVPFNGNEYFQNFYFVGADSDGEVQILNTGKSDNGVPLYYEVETQDLEFGNRSHLKQISDRVQILTKFGSDSSVAGKADDDDYQPIRMPLSRRVNIGEEINLKGNFFRFKWSGVSELDSPMLEGIILDQVSDLGMGND